MTKPSIQRQIAETAQANASAAWQALNAAKIAKADRVTVDLLTADYNMARSIEEKAFANIGDEK